jgi:multidrug efflux pump subunit AcrA (membrane-fusion protein)
MSKPALISQGLLAGGALIALTLLATSQSIQSAEDGDPKSSFECMLEPRMVVKLGAQASGILAQVMVDRGDRVRSGQTVATLESTVEAHNVSVARWRADNVVEVQIAEEASALEDSRFNRRSALWTSKTVSEENYE